jgi:hypothetical protein
MKKHIFLTVIITVTFFFCQAQKGGYSQGNKLFNIGIGVNSYYGGGIPFGASFEFGIKDAISVGLNVDYLSSDYGYLSSNYKFTAIYVGGRGSYHFNEVLNINDEKIDLYGGCSIGYRSFSWSDSYRNESLGGSYGSGIYFGVFIGGKYYFSDKICAFSELGAIGSTNARVGIGFKF